MADITVVQSDTSITVVADSVSAGGEATITLVTGATGATGETGATGPTGPGDVNGPASATDGNIALFDGTTGKLLQDGPANNSTNWNTAFGWGNHASAGYQAEPAEGAFVDGDKTKLDGIETGATADQSAAEILTAVKTVDGTGSGLDADLLDGIEATGFAQKSGTPANNYIGVWTGALAIEGASGLTWDETLLTATVAGTTVGLRLTNSSSSFDWSFAGSTGFFTNYIGGMAFTAAGGDITLTASAGEVIMGSPLALKSYTVAGVPSASTAGAGAMIYVSNETGGAIPAFSDGTNWRRVSDRAVVS